VLENPKSFLAPVCAYPSRRPFPPVYPRTMQSSFDGYAHSYNPHSGDLHHLARSLHSHAAVIFGLGLSSFDNLLCFFSGSLPLLLPLDELEDVRFFRLIVRMSSSRTSRSLDGELLVCAPAVSMCSVKREALVKGMFRRTCVGVAGDG